MDLIFDAPHHHHLVEEGFDEPIEGGSVFTVTDERGGELLADPNVSVREAAPSNLKGLNRGQLDELAEQAGLDPKDFNNRDAVIAALQDHQPEAAGAGHNPIQED